MLYLTQKNIEPNSKPYFEGYKNAADFLKTNSRVIKKVIPDSRKEFSLVINDAFVSRDIKDRVNVGQITVLKKTLNGTKPVVADIVRCVDSEDTATYFLYHNKRMIGSTDVYQEAEPDILKFFKKPHNYIGVMINRVSEQYSKVGRALHDIVKLQTLADDKRLIALHAENGGMSPVGFHSKSGYVVMAGPNKLAETDADRLNENIRKSNVVGVKQVLDKINFMYMSTVLPKK